MGDDPNAPTFDWGDKHENDAGKTSMTEEAPAGAKQALTEEEIRPDNDDGNDGANDNELMAREVQEEPPPPPTRSPLTYAKLLLVVGKCTRAREELEAITRTVALKTKEDGQLGEMRRSPGLLAGGAGCDDKVMGGATPRESTGKASPPGTDVQRFRSPPDPGVVARRDESSTMNDMGGDVAGTDLRRFRGPPDLRKPKPLTGAGTDQQSFRGPPDPRWARIIIPARKTSTGTSVLGFWVPPDGGP